MWFGVDRTTRDMPWHLFRPLSSSAAWSRRVFLPVSAAAHALFPRPPARGAHPAGLVVGARERRPGAHACRFILFGFKVQCCYLVDWSRPRPDRKYAPRSRSLWRWRVVRSVSVGSRAHGRDASFWVIASIDVASGSLWTKR